MNLQGLARNLEQPEIKDWLSQTKDTLMSEKGGKDKEAESAKLGEFLKRCVCGYSLETDFTRPYVLLAGLMR